MLSPFSIPNSFMLSCRVKRLNSVVQILHRNKSVIVIPLCCSRFLPLKGELKFAVGSNGINVEKKLIKVIHLGW